MFAARERTASSQNEPDNWTGYSAGDPISNWVLQTAENPATPTEILHRLAESCNLEVRMAVADNGSALLETVLMLARDDSVDLRYQLAENHNIHQNALMLLCEDSNPYIAHRAKKSLIRLNDGAAIVVPEPVPNVAPLVSITRSASTNALGRKLNRHLAVS